MNEAVERISMIFLVMRK